MSVLLLLRLRVCWSAAYPTSHAVDRVHHTRSVGEVAWSDWRSEGRWLSRDVQWDKETGVGEGAQQQQHITGRQGRRSLLSGSQADL